MSTHPTTPSASPELGARLVALAGLGLVGYGVLFLIRNFTGFIELGLTLAVPPHYAYGLATLGHLGPIYLDTVILLIGSGLAWRALGR